MEVLVRVGLVCDIKPHTVPVPVGEKWKALRESNVNAVQTMVLAKDLVAEGWTHESPWHDAGYDTAWVPADCIPSVFRGGAGWSQGHKEETCVWDGSRISVQRRIVWDTDRTDVNEIEWMWWEDSSRVAAHTHRVGEWVPYSRQISIMIESHYLARQTRGGQNEFVIRIEGGRKIFHEHTGLQYEINLTAMTQKNVMTGYERRLQRRVQQAVVAVKPTPPPRQAQPSWPWARPSWPSWARPSWPWAWPFRRRSPPLPPPTPTAVPAPAASARAHARRPATSSSPSRCACCTIT